MTEGMRQHRAQVLIMMLNRVKRRENQIALLTSLKRMQAKSINPVVKQHSDIENLVNKMLLDGNKNKSGTGSDENKRQEYLLIPVIPSKEHINSIAMRLDHSFPMLTEDQKESRRATARQMYNECSGQGFYTIKTDPVAGGWTGNASADLALTLLGRLDSSLEDDGRIEQIEQIIRGLARGKGY